MEKEGVEPVLAHGASVAPVPTDFPKMGITQRPLDA